MSNNLEGKKVTKESEIDDQTAKNTDEELSDEELEGVAGGAGESVDE